MKEYTALSQQDLELKRSPICGFLKRDLGSTQVFNEDFGLIDFTEFSEPCFLISVGEMPA